MYSNSNKDPLTKTRLLHLDNSKQYSYFCISFWSAGLKSDYNYIELKKQKNYIQIVYKNFIWIREIFFLTRYYYPLSIKPCLVSFVDTDFETAPMSWPLKWTLSYVMEHMRIVKSLVRAGIVVSSSSPRLALDPRPP